MSDHEILEEVLKLLEEQQSVLRDKLTPELSRIYIERSQQIRALLRYAFAKKSA